MNSSKRRPWWAFPLCGALVALGSTSCSSSSVRDGSPTEDAGSPSSVPPPPSERATKTVEMLRAVPAFAENLSATRTLHRVGAGYRLAQSTAGWSPAGGSVEITLPANGSAPLRLELPGQKDFWVEIRSTGADDVTGEVVDGAVVLHDMGEDTDVVHAVAPGRAEEIRVLRSARASTTAHYSVEVGPAVGAVRSSGARFEILDRSGTVRLASAPVFAVDAHGTRRDATITAEGGGSAWELTTTIDVRALEYPIAVDPAWTAAGSMQVGTFGHAAVRLQDGRVLTAGGYQKVPYQVTDTAQIYDPANDSWSLVQNMLNDLRDLRLILLDDGRVLATGGIDEAQVLPPAAALYDSLTGQWSSTNAYSYDGRVAHVATKLLDGRVLIAAGWNGGALQTTEIYDPLTNVWSQATSLPIGPMNAVAVTLNTGKVLLVGGSDYAGTYLDTPFTYDPGLDEWAPAGTLSSPRSNNVGIVLLPSGKVLVAGGGDGVITLNTAEVYDPATNSWSLVQPMNRARGDSNFRMALLPNGRVLAAGGYGNAFGWQQTSEFYDIAADTWTMVGSMLWLHQNATMTSLNDGRVLVAGGTDDEWANCEIFGLYPVGAPCTSANECESTHCRDGYCCDTACTGQCQACNEPGLAGTCSPHPGSPTGGRPACTGAGTACEGYCDGVASTCTYPDATTPCRAASCTNGVETSAATCNGSGTCPLVTQSCGFDICSGSTCGTTCASDTGCSSLAYCDATVTTCTQKKSLGQACTRAGECNSNFCVDGRCCGSTCAGQCEACDVSGKLGICSYVVGAPHGARTACATDGTSCGGACDGLLRTQCLYPSGTQCRPASCTSGVGTLASSCDGAGTCPLVTQTCAPAICEGAACDGDCTLDSECDVTAYCAGTICTTKKDDGQACTGNNACNSGVCVDGVCCDQACGGQCEACDVPGYAGTCSPVPDNTQPHGNRPACTTDGSSCGGACDGIQRAVCAYPGSSTSCRAGSCTSDIATLPAQCNGTGVCPAVATQACAPYHCEGDTCGACSASIPCASGYYCSGGLCQQKQANGTACTGAVQCTSGNCADGVCCSGQCAGQCEACDVAGSVGTCTLVPNGQSPHGTIRPQCGGDATCGGKCTGVSATACGYAPVTAQCRAPSCTSGTAVVEATCDGVGSCPAEQTVICAPDVCVGTQCSGCTLDSDCPGGNHCKAGKCEPFTAKGGACSQASDCVSGLRCVDGVCCDSACSGQCEACDVPGLLGTCSPVPAGEQPSGGRSPCPGTGTCGATCDGTSRTACAYPGGEEICALGSCADGTETSAAYCNGNGACPDQETVSCGVYACGATTCSTTCAGPTDCAFGYWCSGTACLPVGVGPDSGAGGEAGAGAVSGAGAGGGQGGAGGAGGSGAGAAGTSAGGSGAAGASGAAGGGTAGAGFGEPLTGSEGGCGCRTPSTKARDSSAGALSLLALLVLARRRAQSRGSLC